MDNNYNPIYGCVTFKEFEAAGQKVAEYLSGLACTVKIRDMVKDEIRENLKKDLVIAAIVELSMEGARRRFDEALKGLSEDIIRKEAPETTETPAKTETL